MTPGTTVGRERELAELLALLDDGDAGRGGVAVVAGGPGIGKTHLAAATALEAERRGTAVAWATCWKGGGLRALWPWVQVLRAAALDVPLLDAPQRGAHRDPASDRAEVFDAITTALLRSASARPLLVVIDDVQWADAASRELLTFLATQVRQAPLVLLATVRDRQPSPAPDVVAALDELGRLGRRLDLDGLSTRAVHALAGAVGREDVDEASANRLAEHTGGNPLFVIEILRAMPAERADARGPLPLPASVAAVIRQALDALPDAGRAALDAAAVQGPEFDLDATAVALDRAPFALFEDLVPALEAGLVALDPPARGRFSHPLVAEVLLDALPPARRARLSAATARALVARPGAEDLAPTIARQLVAAGAAADPVEAVAWSMRAGAQAVRAFAYEEAVDHLEAAVALAERHVPGQLVDVLLALGDARWRAGDIPACERAFTRAGRLAEVAGDATRQARAALGRARVPDPLLRTNIVPVLEDALAALPPGDSPEAATLLGTIATKLLLARDQRERRVSLAARAVAMARRLGDPVGVAVALHQEQAARWTPRNRDERLVAAQQILAIAEAEDDDELALRAHAWSLTGFLEAGDRRGIDVALDGLVRIAERVRRPYWRFYARSRQCTVALIDGALDVVDALVPESMALGRAAHLPEAAGIVTSQAALAAQLRGELTTAHPLFTEMLDVRRFPFSGPQIYTAHVLALIGETSQGQDLLARLAPRAHEVVEEFSGVASVHVLGQIAAELEDTHAAPPLAAALAPFSGTFAVAGGATTCFGPVDHAVGLLAALEGRHADAEAHLRAALAQADAVRSPTFAVESQLALARLLARTGRGDEALGVARAACATSDRLGFAFHAGRARALIAAVAAGAAPASVAPLSAALRRVERGWVVDVNGTIAHLPAIRGLAQLARLVSQPHQEVHALDLLAGRHVPRPAGTAPMLDEDAKRAYRARLADLHEDLDEAHERHDPERAAKAQSEIDALVSELARAIGLSGRDRRLGSDAERARVNVTRTLRAAIERMRRVTPVLAAHLDRSVVTGTFCAYAPRAGEAPVRWEVHS